MVDRLVRQIDTHGTSEQEPKQRLFSVFDNERHLVLLGTPGAGKTHLFRFFATADSRLYLTARQFLVYPDSKFHGITHLFIDALDEQRSGRDADSVIDRIAGKLVQLNILYVRLACRAADWLGDNDLSTLNLVTGTDEEFIILVLEPLSPAEQATLLRTLGALQPEQFIEQAVSRGLESMLDNPQTLTMLWNQVNAKAGEWPATRRALFANAVNLLLSEHDIAHRRLAKHDATAEQQKEAAGAACALRLISDIRGIALQEDRTSEDCPGYDEISLVPRTHLLNALGSRLFTTDEIADYLHRTLAEFVAAEWLADRVRQGLPSGRIIALITQNGIPTTELRGLHAWLAVHLPEQASVLIDADPFGVMTYGDPASLSPGARCHLINALSRLAQRDPWFRSGHWETPVSGLGQTDLIPQFSDILLTQHESHSLRGIVFDAIKEGHLAESMADVLCDVAKNSAILLNERRTAVDLLLHTSENGLHRVRSMLSCLSDTREDISLRGYIIRELNGRGVKPEAVMSLLSAIFHEEDHLPIGAFWRLDEAIPDSDVITILDDFTLPDAVADDGSRYLNLSGVTRILSNLARRAIINPVTPAAEKILRWLDKITQLSQEYYPECNRVLGETLASNRPLLARLITQHLAVHAGSHEPWRAIHDLNRLLARTTDWSLLLECAMTDMRTATDSTRPFYFEIALYSALQAGTSVVASFGELVEMQDNTAFRTIIERLSISEIQDERLDMMRRLAHQNTLRQAERRNNQQYFDTHRSAIEAGTDREGLGMIGLFFYAIGRGLDAEATPRDRLIDELGAERAELALKIAESLAFSGPYPSVEEIFDCDAGYEERGDWYTFMAGLSEGHSKGFLLAETDKNRLRAALIVDRLCSTFITEGKKSSVRQHSWQRELLENNPTFVAETYALLIRHHIELGREHVAGLAELVGYPELAGIRAHYVMLLLRDFITCTGRTLKSLTACAFVDAPEQFAEIIPTGLKSAIATGRASDWMLWTVFGLLSDVPGCEEAITQAGADTVTPFIWAIRNAVNLREERLHADAQPISIKLETFAIRLVGSRQALTYHPHDGWSGDCNPWDASDFVIARIKKLSATPTQAATDALIELITDDALKSYRKHLQHALTTQRVRYADAHFRRPSWQEVQQSLSGGIPANIADLQALVMDLISTIGQQIAGANTDPHKQFWNVDSYGRIDNPKPEEICRDAFVEMLRGRLRPLGLHVEPEGHMSSDKRADICIMGPRMKLVIELKRHYHAELWTAVEQQLGRFYTRDPDAQGFGIYGIFWFGLKKAPAVPTPNEGPVPQTAEALKKRLKAKITEKKIDVFVFDVSGE